MSAHHDEQWLKQIRNSIDDIAQNGDRDYAGPQLPHIIQSLANRAKDKAEASSAGWGSEYSNNDQWTKGYVDGFNARNSYDKGFEAGYNC